MSTLGLGQRKSTGAVLELLVAAALWGFGFVATKWSLAAAGPNGITAIRFAAAVVFGSILVLAIKRRLKSFSGPFLRLAFWPGILLSITLVLQTWGMKYTSATKSGFITTLYALFVPFWEALFFKRPILRRHLVAIGLALWGAMLIANFRLGEAFDYNLGDLLTFLCAVVASIQIVVLGMVAPKVSSPFEFNISQTFWATLVPLSILPFAEPAPVAADFFKGHLPLIGILFLALGSTLIAFHLQISSQRYISSTLAGLLCLMEAPFAALFAVALLGETLTPSQWFGAGLIFAGVTLAVIGPSAQSVNPSPGRSNPL